MGTQQLKCLLSHKCGSETHAFGEVLRTHLALAEIDLLVDPFRAGDDVTTRMNSFEFDAFVFLLSPESMASRFCQIELETAKFRSVPFFVVQMSGMVPEEFRNSAILKLTSTKDPNLPGKLCELAASIRERVLFDTDMKLLHSDGTMFELHESAERLGTQADRTVIAEHVTQLAKIYNSLADATAKYWVAIALGRAGTPDAITALKSFPTSDHPFALQGVDDALQMAGRKP